MTTELKFSDIKDEVQGMMDDTLKKNLDEKTYDQKEAQELIKGIVDEIIKNLRTNYKDINLLLMEQFSKKEILLFIILLLVFGILILMVLQLPDMKMILYMLLLLVLELFLKIFIKIYYFYLTIFLR